MSLATDASHGGGWTLAFMHWLLATQRGETFEGPTSRKTTLSSPLVDFTSVWFALTATDSTAKLSPHTPCFNGGGVHRLSALREHVTTGRRTSLPPPTSGGYDDFSPDFSRSITRRFFDLTAEVSPGPSTSLLRFRQGLRRTLFQLQSSPTI